VAQQLGTLRFSRNRVRSIGSSSWRCPESSSGPVKSRTLFIVARDDANDDGPRLPGIRAQYLKAPEPKELIVLDGEAHAQFLFETDQADRVIDEIFRFLSAP